ncbi:hypothetical protein CYMTET_5611, partial [Cymbomonas tetramitiformis]
MFGLKQFVEDMGNPLEETEGIDNPGEVYESVLQRKGGLLALFRSRKDLFAFWRVPLLIYNNPNSGLGPWSDPDFGVWILPSDGKGQPLPDYRLPHVPKQTAQICVQFSETGICKHGVLCTSKHLPHCFPASMKTFWEMENPHVNVASIVSGSYYGHPPPPSLPPPPTPLAEPNLPKAAPAKPAPPTEPYPGPSPKARPAPSQGPAAPAKPAPPTEPYPGPSPKAGPAPSQGPAPPAVPPVTKTAPQPQRKPVPCLQFIQTGCCANETCMKLHIIPAKEKPKGAAAQASTPSAGEAAGTLEPGAAQGKDSASNPEVDKAVPAASEATPKSKPEGMLIFNHGKMYPKESVQPGDPVGGAPKRARGPRGQKRGERSNEAGEAAPEEAPLVPPPKTPPGSPPPTDRQPAANQQWTKSWGDEEAVGGQMEVKMGGMTAADRAGAMMGMAQQGMGEMEEGWVHGSHPNVMHVSQLAAQSGAGGAMEGMMGRMDRGWMPGMGGEANGRMGAGGGMGLREVPVGEPAGAERMPAGLVGEGQMLGSGMGAMVRQGGMLVGGNQPVMMAPMGTTQAPMSNMMAVRRVANGQVTSILAGHLRASRGKPASSLLGQAGFEPPGASRLRASWGKAGFEPPGAKPAWSLTPCCSLRTIIDLAQCGCRACPGTPSFPVYAPVMPVMQGQQVPVMRGQQVPVMRGQQVP